MTRTSTSILAVIAISASVMTAALAQPGGFRDVPVTNKEVIAAAEFAVKAQRLNEKGKLDLAAIVKAEQQVVAGINYRLKVLVDVEGGKRDAEAVVWSKLDRTMQLTNWTWKGEVRPDKK